jgi:hypothetical protein
VPVAEVWPGWQLGFEIEKNVDIIGVNQTGKGTRVTFDWSATTSGLLDLSVGDVTVDVADMPKEVSNAVFELVDQPNLGIYNVHWPAADASGELVPGGTNVRTLRVSIGGQKLANITWPPDTFDLKIQSLNASAPTSGIDADFDALVESATQAAEPWLQVSGRLSGERSSLAHRMDIGATVKGTTVFFDDVSDNLNLDFAMPVTRPPSADGQAKSVFPAFTLSVTNPNRDLEAGPRPVAAKVNITKPGVVSATLVDVRSVHLDTRTEANTKMSGASNTVSFGPKGRAEVALYGEEPGTLTIVAPDENLEGRLYLTTCGKGFNDVFVDLKAKGAFELVFVTRGATVFQIRNLTGGVIDFVNGWGKTNLTFGADGYMKLSSSAMATGGGATGALEGGLSPTGDCTSGGGGPDFEFDLELIKPIRFDFTHYEVEADEPSGGVDLTWRQQYEGRIFLRVKLDLGVTIGIDVVPTIRSVEVCNLGCEVTHVETTEVDHVAIAHLWGCDSFDYYLLRSGDRKSHCVAASQGVSPYPKVTLRVASDGSVQGTQQALIQEVNDAWLVADTVAEERT